MQKHYPNAEVIKSSPQSVLLPGLTNPHVHLEFSANQGLLHFGAFIPWLQSVIAHRDELQSAITSEKMSQALNTILQGGTTAIGAVSSFGIDLEACIKAPLYVTYFTEILGSRPDAVDILFSDFKSRLRGVMDGANERFIPAISVHSPYSTHPILAKNALDIARKEKLCVSTHFMESQAERAWLDSGSGEFKEFFNAFSPYAAPFCDGLGYISFFENVHTLFTHAVQANKSELTRIKDQGGHITHCPVSNRMLGCGALDIQKLEDLQIPWHLGTDGLSSNTSLSLWDEMRNALMIHNHLPLETLAKELLLGATSQSANALGLNAGSLEVGKEATFLVLDLPGASAHNLPLHAILHTQKPHSIYLQGEKINV
jgi:cytosine/adenosine deaminase-related metal-dependent hydrolase